MSEDTKKRCPKCFPPGRSDKVDRERQQILACGNQSGTNTGFNHILNEAGLALGMRSRIVEIESPEILTSFLGRAGLGVIHLTLEDDPVYLVNGDREILAIFKQRKLTEKADANSSK